VAAPDGKVGRHAVAHLKTRDGASNRDDDSCCLVPWHDVTGVGSFAANDGIAVIKAHITSADGRGLRLHQDFMGCGLGLFAVGNDNLLVTGEDYCTHFRDSFLLFVGCHQTSEGASAPRSLCGHSSLHKVGTLYRV
jgi:hypothetical protein